MTFWAGKWDRSECTKAGRVFDGDLDRYDALVFYSCGDLFLPSVRKTPPMSPDGRKRLLAAVAGGKPFVGLHSACYWGNDPAPDDPYLAMLRCKFVRHGEQQEADMKAVSPSFPGAKGIGENRLKPVLQQTVAQFPDVRESILFSTCAE